MRNLVNTASLAPMPVSVLVWHPRLCRGGGIADGSDLTVVVGRGGGYGLPVQPQHRLSQKQ